MTMSIIITDAVCAVLSVVFLWRICADVADIIHRAKT